MNREGIRKIIVLLPGVLCGLVLLIVFYKWIAPVAAPFIIGWLSASAVRAPAIRISRITKTPVRVCRAALAILFTLIVCALFGVLVWQLAAFLAKFAVDISNSGALDKIITSLSEIKLPLGDDISAQGIARSIKDGVESVISELVSSLGALLASFATAVPKSFLFIVVTMISIVYFSLDLEKINASVKRVLPHTWVDKISFIRARVFKICYKYAKSCLQMLLITFVILLVGFIIIGEIRAVSLALVVSLVDLLPILGIGTVLLPWSVFCIAIGEVTKGVSLLVLFVVAVVVRELLEPRIMGKNLGIHPLLTLITIYVGYELFGFLGMIFLPAVAVTVSALFDKDDTSEIG